MRRLPSIFLSAILAAASFAAEQQGVAIANTAAFSGPVVHVSSPFGLRYRPGAPFPIRISVANPGATLTAAVTLHEGGKDGPRTAVFDRILLESGSSRVSPLLTLRGPSGTANILLSIREVRADGGVGGNPFNGTLVGALTPLPAEMPLLLACGLRNSLPGAVNIAAKDFPEQPWLYEAVDLLVLGDESFARASPAARDAVRRWLNGGGRLLLADNAALKPAVEAGLLPVPPNMAFGSDLSWWEQHAGVRSHHILHRTPSRPVYVRLPVGLGQTVFVFPGTTPEVAQKFGADLIQHPALQRQREKAIDQRVQPDRYDYFSYGQNSNLHQPRARLWIAVGALIFCAALGWGYTARSRWEMVVLPLAAGALLAVLVANGFPAPELLLSRVNFAQVSLDGTTVARQEWVLAKAFRSPDLIDVTAADGALLSPLYPDPEFLNAATLEYAESKDALALKEVPVYPEQPALFVASSVENTAAAPSPQVFKAKDGSPQFAAANLPRAIQKRVAILLQSKSFSLLRNLDALEGFTLERYNGLEAALQEAFGRSGGETVLKARSKVLQLATKSAIRSGQDALILFDTEGDGENLIEIGRSETETRFSVVLIQLQAGR